MSPAERRVFEGNPWLHMQVTKFLAKLDAGWLWVERQDPGSGAWAFYALLLPDEYEVHAQSHRLRVHQHPY